jgi:hypothetical protein
LISQPQELNENTNKVSDFGPSIPQSNIHSKCLTERPWYIHPETVLNAQT